mmetsp:Transcript_70424/g.228973  ORF Transcript_70424/g.228973 Transcript_70424/m.228973 type:complete len:438 (+) Transcript_70424:79-1392(+)
MQRSAPLFAAIALAVPRAGLALQCQCKPFDSPPRVAWQAGGAVIGAAVEETSWVDDRLAETRELLAKALLSRTWPQKLDFAKKADQVSLLCFTRSLGADEFSAVMALRLRVSRLVDRLLDGTFVNVYDKEHVEGIEPVAPGQLVQLFAAMRDDALAGTALAEFRARRMGASDVWQEDVSLGDRFEWHTTDDLNLFWFPRGRAAFRAKPEETHRLFNFLSYLAKTGGMETSLSTAFQGPWRGRHSSYLIDGGLAKRPDGGFLALAFPRPDRVWFSKVSWAWFGGAWCDHTQVYEGRLRDGEVHWDDGDVWFSTKLVWPAGWTCHNNKNFLHGECLTGACPLSEASSTQACADICYATKGCVWFVHNRYNQCHLKQNVTDGPQELDDDDVSHGTVSCEKDGCFKSGEQCGYIDGMSACGTLCCSKTMQTGDGTTRPICA